MRMFRESKMLRGCCQRSPAKNLKIFILILLVALLILFIRFHKIKESIGEAHIPENFNISNLIVHVAPLENLTTTVKPDLTTTKVATTTMAHKVDEGPKYISASIKE